MTGNPAVRHCLHVIFYTLKRGQCLEAGFSEPRLLAK